VTPVVVIRPLSGYINRLQAIVSAQLLAEELGAGFWIDWQPSDVAPVSVDAVLDPDFCRQHARTELEIISTTGVSPANMPPYLTTDSARGVITLAGLDRGEQAFMPELKEVWASGNFTTIVISAGGKFTLQGSARLSPAEERAFQARRYGAYQRLALNPGIEEQAAVAMAGHEPFVGLHLRYSDRSLESPWSRQITHASRRLREMTGVRSLFVASDTPKARAVWAQRAVRMGFEPWSTDPPNVPRSDPRSAWGALIDWRILTRSSAMVFFAASSFAEEAVVASGECDRGIALKASADRRAWMQARQWSHAAVTYPRRHGWFGQ
jgi:hypothetical protein